MSHPEDCPICAAIDPNKSHVENARRLDVAESTIRRHRAHINPTDEYFGIPNEIITSRGKTVRLPDGSYEKITYSPAKAALLETLKYDDLERAIDGYVFTPAPRSRNPKAAVLNAADLQFGKANQRGGGTPQLLARANRSLHQFAEYCRETNPREILLTDGGDGIENIFNTPAQAVTNDLDVPAQIRALRKFMITALKLLAPLSPQLTYLAVPSNHGAFRTGFKAAGGSTDADFGLEVFEQLKDVCEDHKYLSEVQFVKPEPLYETAVIELAGTKLAYNHGHQSNSVFGQGAWWAKQDHGRMPGWDADILVTAHYHTDAMYRSGNGRPVIACASSDVGSDWFTNRTGESALPGMTTFDVVDGEFWNMRLV